MTTVEIVEPGTLLGLWLDDDLIDAEFEAIIAAEYPTLHRPPATHAWCRPRRGRFASRRPVGRKMSPSAPVTGEDGHRRRERSPPDIVRN